MSLKALHSYESDVEVNGSSKSGTIITNQNYIHEANVSGLISENPYCLSISKLSSRLLPENIETKTKFLLFCMVVKRGRWL